MEETKLDRSNGTQEKASGPLVNPTLPALVKQDLKLLRSSSVSEPIKENTQASGKRSRIESSEDDETETRESGLSSAFSLRPNELQQAILKATEAITKATTRESNSKISFSRADQAMVREKTDEIVFAASAFMAHQANINARIFELACGLANKEGEIKVLQTSLQELRTMTEIREGEVRDSRKKILDLSLNQTEDESMGPKGLSGVLLEVMKEMKDIKKDIQDLKAAKPSILEADHTTPPNENPDMLREMTKEVSQLKYGIRDLKTQLEITSMKEVERNNSNLEKSMRNIVMETEATSEPGTSSEAWSEVVRRKKDKPKIQTMASATRRPGATPSPNYRKTKHVMIVNVKEVDNSVQARKKLYEKIDMNKIKGPVAAIRTLGVGRMVIEAHTEEQKDCLIEQLKDKEDIETLNLKNANPKIILIGIEKGYENNELLDIIKDQNPALLQYGVGQNDLKVVSKRPCRNQYVENWVIEVKPPLFKVIMREGHVNVDLLKVRVEEANEIARCFKCNEFGHVQKYCKNKECCLRCGGEHPAKNCQSEALQCVNCKKAGLKVVEHATTDPDCPIYIRKNRLAKSRINYG